VVLVVKVRVQAPSPLQPPPLQPAKLDPVAATGVKVTGGTAARGADWVEQAGPRLIPTGVLVTVPLPVPVLAIDKVILSITVQINVVLLPRMPSETVTVTVYVPAALNVMASCL
jgi:hypothetical protein